MSNMIKQAQTTDQNSNAIIALCENTQCEPQVLCESMHLLLTKAINLLQKLESGDPHAAEQIDQLPFYALAGITVAANHMNEFNTFRKEVGDNRSLADFIADKRIVTAPSNPDPRDIKQPATILSNFAMSHARSATEKLKQAFQASKKDPATRAKLIQAMREGLRSIDTVYSRVIGQKSQQPAAQPNQQQTQQKLPQQSQILQKQAAGYNR